MIKCKTSAIDFFLNLIAKHLLFIFLLFVALFEIFFSTHEFTLQPLLYGRGKIEIMTQNELQFFPALDIAHLVISHVPLVVFMQFHELLVTFFVVAFCIHTSSLSKAISLLLVILADKLNLLSRFNVQLLKPLSCHFSCDTARL